MKRRRSHVVPLAATCGERLDSRKDPAKKLHRTRAQIAPANFLDSLEFELTVILAACFGQAIGAKEERIARLHVDNNFVVGRFRK
jgi:hypothetical protein